MEAAATNDWSDAAEEMGPRMSLGLSSRELSTHGDLPYGGMASYPSSVRDGQW